MKSRYFILTLIGCVGLVSSYAQGVGKQDRSLYERVSSIEKRSNGFNFFLNTNAAFNVMSLDGKMAPGGFKFNDLRLEASGDVSSKIYYRYRQRINRPNNPEKLDNLPNSLDYAAIGYRFTPKFSLFAGKQSMVYGGFEFDKNPIDIIQYSDMIWNMSNYMTGVTLDYQFNSNQQVMFQILNSRTASFNETYGSLSEPVKQHDISLSYTINYNAAYWDNLLKLRWSATILNESKRNNMYYFALGQQLNFNKFSLDADFMLSFEALDRKRMMSGVLDDGFTARNARYMSVVAQATYTPIPILKVFLKGMYETSSVYKAYSSVAAGKYRTALGYLAGVEYYPNVSGLHFFVSYIGRSYNYTARAKSYGRTNYNTDQISIGLIYRLRMY